MADTPVPHAFPDNLQLRSIIQPTDHHPHHLPREPDRLRRIRGRHIPPRPRILRRPVLQDRRDGPYHLKVPRSIQAVVPVILKTRRSGGCQRCGRRQRRRHRHPYLRLPALLFTPLPPREEPREERRRRRLGRAHPDDPEEEPQPARGPPDHQARVRHAEYPGARGLERVGEVARGGLQDGAEEGCKVRGRGCEEVGGVVSRT